MATYEMTIKVFIPEDFGDFQVIESKLVEASREAGRGLLQRIFVDYEAWRMERKPVQKKDQREKVFETLLGKIRMNRWRVRDVSKGKCVYPVDEWMGLKAYQKVSPGLMEEIVEQSVQRPYAQATRVCARLSGVRRSVMSNWKLMQGVAKRKQEPKPTGLT